MVKSKKMKGRGRGKKDKEMQEITDDPVNPPILDPESTPVEDPGSPPLPKKKKKKKKAKKMSKKEKAKLAAAQAEELRLVAETERLRLVEEEKERLEAERIAAEAKAKRDVEEQAIREVQLEVTLALFHSVKQKMFRKELAVRANEEWTQYLKCDGLPDPASLSEVNTYLYVWRLDLKHVHIEDVMVKTGEVLGILGVMEELIDDPLDNTPAHVQDWKELRNDVRAELQLRIDHASYLLLRHVDTAMKMSEWNVVDYNITCDFFTLYLWGLLPLPVPLDPPVPDIGHKSECEFPDLGLHLHLPSPLSESYLCIRALWVKHDHLSDTARSFEPPPMPSRALVDILAQTLDEYLHLATLHPLYDNEVVERNEARARWILPFDSPGGPAYVTPNIDLTKRLAPPLLQYHAPLIPKELWEHIHTPDERLALEQEAGETELMRRLTYQPAAHELNLRRYTILSGVLYLDLLVQPPQPTELAKRFTITTLSLPKQLVPVDFHVSYTPPPPPEPGQRRLPEEIEAELKQQEAELDKLCLVTITLPNNVLWFDPPIVAGWDEEKKLWSTEDYHDLKFNEEKQILAFRTGRLRPIGLAVYRYCNLPYQTWEMKPDHKTGGVALSITATIAVVEFIIKDDLVCVSALQNGATSALQEIVGIYYKPKKLIRLLTQGGVDIFPSHDAVCYVEGVTSKHRSCEDHLYHCLSLLATAYNFAWSRWNLLSGYRSIVIQMREFLDRRKLPLYSMLHVTPLKACIVDCTEVGQVFVEEGIPGMKFYSDLYHLVQDHGSPVTKKKIADIPFQLSETIYEMLSRIKPLSFS